MSTTIEQLQAASARSQEIVQEFAVQEKPDVLAARAAELAALKKDDLIALVLTLEKPKQERAFKIEDIAQRILEDPLCAIFSYEQIAGIVQQILPEAKTSSKSIASYVNKRKEEWDIVPREKIKMNIADLLQKVG